MELQCVLCLADAAEVRESLSAGAAIVAFPGELRQLTVPPELPLYRLQERVERVGTLLWRLIVADLVMSDIDGPEVTPHLRSIPEFAYGRSYRYRRRRSLWTARRVSMQIPMRSSASPWIPICMLACMADLLGISWIQRDAWGDVARDTPDVSRREVHPRNEGTASARVRRQQASSRGASRTTRS